MSAPAYQHREPSPTEDEKRPETDVAVNDVYDDQLHSDAESRINIKKLIRKVDYRLLPGLGLL